MKTQERFYCPLDGRLSFEQSYAKGLLKEKGIDDIYENEYSLLATYKSLLSSLGLSYTYRDFSSARDINNYFLELKTFLFPGSDFTYIFARDNIEAVKAVNLHVQYYKNVFLLRQELSQDLILRFKYQHNYYNDDNSRNTLNPNISYVFFHSPNLSIGYDFLYDDTKSNSADYYTPRLLEINKLQFLMNGDLFIRKFKYSFNCGLGYASEKEAKNRFINSYGVDLTYELGKSWEVAFSSEMFESATYKSRDAQLAVRYMF